MVVKIVLKVVDAGWQIDGGVNPCLIVKFFHHGCLAKKLVNLEGFKEKKLRSHTLITLSLSWKPTDNVVLYIYKFFRVIWKIIKQYTLNIIL